MHEQGRHLASIVYKLDLRGERNATFGFDIQIKRKLIVIPPNLNIGRLRSAGGKGGNEPFDVQTQ